MCVLQSAVSVKTFYFISEIILSLAGNFTVKDAQNCLVQNYVTVSRLKIRSPGTKNAVRGSVNLGFFYIKCSAIVI